MDERVDAMKFKCLLERLRDECFSYTKAVKIVGGEKRLERLVADGLVRCEKPVGKRNTMWRFNAEDVLNHVRPSLKILNESV